MSEATPAPSSGPGEPPHGRGAAKQRASLIGGSGRHFRLNSWILANILWLGTQSFCRRFLNQANDPCGRQYDQMTQAARSVCANIAEGAARHDTSRETEMRLTDVARASLAELEGDFLHWLMAHGHAPWPKASREAQAVLRQPLDPPHYAEGELERSACLHIMAQAKRFRQWLAAEEGVRVANALLLLSARVAQLLHRQLRAQEAAFKEEGGFAEALTQVRLDSVREQARRANAETPACPKCGQPMRKRLAKRGPNAGHPFWSCADYPNCTSTRPCAEGANG